MIVTVKEQLAESPASSVTVQVTVVVPMGKVEPEAGAQTTVGSGQLSLVVGVKLTTAEH